MAGIDEPGEGVKDAGRHGAVEPLEVPLGAP